MCAPQHVVSVVTMHASDLWHCFTNPRAQVVYGRCSLALKYLAAAPEQAVVLRCFHATPTCAVFNTLVLLSATLCLSQLQLLLAGQRWLTLWMSATTPLLHRTLCPPAPHHLSSWHMLHSDTARSALISFSSKNHICSFCLEKLAHRAWRELHTLPWRC